MNPEFWSLPLIAWAVGLLSLTTSILATSIGVKVYRNHWTDRGSTPFVIGAVLTTILGLTNAGTVFLSSPALVVPLEHITFGLEFYCSWIYLWLTYAYVKKRGPRTSKVVRYTGIIATLLVGAVILNPLHHLIWTPAEITVHTDPLVRSDPDEHLFFWAITAYTYLELLLSTIIFMMYARDSGRLAKSQAGSLLLGLLIASSLNLLSLPDYLPYHLDYTPVSMGGFVVIIYIALYASDLFSVQPVSRGQILEVINDAVLVLDDDYIITDSNSASRQLFPEASPGNSLHDVLPSTALQRLTKEIDEISMTDVSHPTAETAVATYDLGEILLHEDGTERYLSVRGVPFAFPSSTELDSLILVFHDVTDLRQEQQKLEEKTTELQRQNERLDRFAETVAHDLRSPLSVATAYISMTRDTGDLENLEEVEAALDRMDEMIDDILTLAQEGDEIGEPVERSLADLASNAWETVETDDAELEIVDSGIVTTDPSRITQLFENLYRNAIEHNPSSVTLQVGMTAHGFYVADNGRGIPPTQREDVFAGGFTTQDDGTGFGLAIVEEIAAAHGWGIVVGESQEGGARFEFITESGDDFSIEDDSGTVIIRTPSGGQISSENNNW